LADYRVHLEIFAGPLDLLLSPEIAFLEIALPELTPDNHNAVCAALNGLQKVEHLYLSCTEDPYHPYRGWKLKVRLSCCIGSCEGAVMAAKRNYSWFKLLHLCLLVVLMQTSSLSEE